MRVNSNTPWTLRAEAHSVTRQVQPMAVRKSINLNELAPTIEAAVHAAIDGPGFVPTPKSADPGRQMENLDIFVFTLSDEEMVALGSLDRPDPQMLDADSFGH